MSVLRRYLIGLFLPVFAAASLFFLLILQLADLYSNFSKYLSNGVPFLSILWGMLLYVPKCFSFSLPIALLFAVSYTMGMLYANNELIAIFSSGISLFSLTIPIMCIGLFLSGASLLFEDAVVIPTVKLKNTHTRTMLKQKVQSSSSNISVLSRGGEVVWKVDYYNDENASLSGISILERDANAAFVSSINAQSALWENSAWTLKNVTRFYWNRDHSWLTSEYLSSWNQANLDERPETFRRATDLIEEMTLSEAASFIERKRQTGFSFSGDLAEYWKRFAFALTPFIVVFISCSIGGRFRKNILLMSLSVSLMTSVLYYVVQMVTMLLAKFDRLSPFMGAWFPVFIFFALGAALFRSART